MKKQVIKEDVSNIKVFSSLPTEIQDLICRKIDVLEADVDPLFLERLSKLLEKELKAVKDTEDYNLNTVSTLIDKVIIVFTETGQDAFESGDYLQVYEKVSSKLTNKDLLGDLNQAKITGDYGTFPFSSAIEAEIRANFILKSNRKDSFKKLFEEFELRYNRYMTSKDFDIIQKAIQKAIPRLKKSKLFFPAPPEGYEQGVLRPLTMEEIEEFNLATNTMIDEREDFFDLLALKDLISLLKGEPVHTFSMAPSFFAKFIPEINELGYEGVLLKIKNEKLESIKLTRLPANGISYSPVNAACQLFFNAFVSLQENHDSSGKKFSLKNEGSDVFTNEDRYFLVVDGCVAYPSDKKPVAYESPSKNDARLKSGEVFLFEKQDGEVVQTRIGFVPYDYSVLHLLHQHGSIIYGANDQSFQSCYANSEDFKEFEINRYKEYWSDLVKLSASSQGDGFSPAVVASRIHHFLNDDKGKLTESADILKPENYTALELALHSISEISEFTKIRTLSMLFSKHYFYSGDILDEITNLCKFEAPLNRRFLLKKYLEDGSGITKEKQPTYYIKLAKALENAKQNETISFLLKLQKVNEKVESGLSKEDAIKSIFSTDET